MRRDGHPLNQRHKSYYRPWMTYSSCRSCCRSCCCCCLRRMHRLRFRSYLYVLLFSLICSFFILFMTISIREIDPQTKTRNSSLTRPHSCLDCFHTEFPVLVNHPEICAVGPGEVIDMVFFIFTHPDGLDTRTVIRNTWASVTRNNTSHFRHVFVTGLTPDPRRMRRLVEESRQFRDLVISEFNDSYQNLTLKTMSSMRWVLRYCSQARFFFKVDDDVWLNTRRLLDRFNQSLELQQGGLGGNCHMSSKVIRETSSKWYASYESYPDDKYPKYCSGVSYGGTLQTARKVMQVSRNIPFFYLEDVYIGLCLQELKIPPVHFEEMDPAMSWDLCEAYSDSVMSYHRVSPRLLTRIWNQKSCGSSPWWRLLTLDILVFRG